MNETTQHTCPSRAHPSDCPASWPARTGESHGSPSRSSSSGGWGRCRPSPPWCAPWGRKTCAWSGWLAQSHPAVVWGGGRPGVEGGRCGCPWTTAPGPICQSGCVEEICGYGMGRLGNQGNCKEPRKLENKNCFLTVAFNTVAAINIIYIRCKQKCAFSICWPLSNAWFYNLPMTDIIFLTNRWDPKNNFGYAYHF